VTAANVNDGKRLDAVLSAIIIKRKRPTVRRSKHLCADAGYRSAENLRVIDEHGYIAHVLLCHKSSFAHTLPQHGHCPRRAISV